MRREYHRRIPQLGLFDRPAPYAAGSPTSQAAAAEIRPAAGTLRSCVLAFIRGRGWAGATCEEIEIGLQLKHQTASARMRELAQEALIAKAGKRRQTSSGRAAEVWIARELAMQVRA